MRKFRSQLLCIFSPSKDKLLKIGQMRSGHPTSSLGPILEIPSWAGRRLISKPLFFKSIINALGNSPAIVSTGSILKYLLNMNISPSDIKCVSLYRSIHGWMDRQQPSIEIFGLSSLCYDPWSYASPSQFIQKFRWVIEEILCDIFFCSRGPWCIMSKFMISKKTYKFQMDHNIEPLLYMTVEGDSQRISYRPPTDQLLTGQVCWNIS